MDRPRKEPAALYIGWKKLLKCVVVKEKRLGSMVVAPGEACSTRIEGPNFGPQAHGDSPVGSLGSSHDLGHQRQAAPPLLLDSIRQATLGPDLRANCGSSDRRRSSARGALRNAGSAAALSVGVGAWIKGEAEQAVEWPQDSLAAPPA